LQIYSDTQRLAERADLEPTAAGSTIAEISSNGSFWSLIDESGRPQSAGAMRRCWQGWQPDDRDRAAMLADRRPVRSQTADRLARSNGQSPLRHREGPADVLKDCPARHLAAIWVDVSADTGDDRRICADRLPPTTQSPQ